jgi:hypothetical protein
MTRKEKSSTQRRNEDHRGRGEGEEKAAVEDGGTSKQRINVKSPLREQFEDGEGLGREEEG